MWKGQSARGAFCLFSINNRRHELTAMQIPKSALNPGSSRNGNSLVVIAAEQDTWANYSVWEAELISPDAASHWHSYNPSGTSCTYYWLDISVCLQPAHRAQHSMLCFTKTFKRRRGKKGNTKNMFLQRKQWQRAHKNPQKTLNIELQHFCKGGGLLNPQCCRPKHNNGDGNFSSVDTPPPLVQWHLIEKGLYHYNKLMSKSSLLPNNENSEILILP